MPLSQSAVCCTRLRKRKKNRAAATVVVVAEQLSIQKKKKADRENQLVEEGKSGVVEKVERELSKPQAGATDRLRPI